MLIGYSLPPTDLHATALFRTSVKPAALRSLVVVNPDRDARRRTREVLQRGLSEETRVHSFDSFAEFLALEPSVWRPGAGGLKPPSPRGRGNDLAADGAVGVDVRESTPPVPNASDDRTPLEGSSA